MISGNRTLYVMWRRMTVICEKDFEVAFENFKVVDELVFDSGQSERFRQSAINAFSAVLKPITYMGDCW